MTRQSKVNQIELRKLEYETNVSKVYYKHAVIYGDYIDVRIYDNVKITFKNDKNRNYTKSDKGIKRGDSVSRARNNIYRLVQANTYKHGKFKPVFTTYTFAQPITDITEANREFKLFIQRINYHLKTKIKYVCIPEIQKSREKSTGFAVWHFHTVYFNCPFIPKKTHQDIWGNGWARIEIARSVRDVGSYLAKYLSKVIMDSRTFGKKVLFTSRGLIRPIDLFNTQAIDNVLKNAIKVVSHYQGSCYKQIKYKIQWKNNSHSSNILPESTREMSMITSL